MSKRLQIRGCTLRYRTLEEKLTVTRRFATQAVPLLANGKIKPVVEHVYPLHEIADAHIALEENRNFGKLILSLDK
jgi:NADPH:quinone reductase-like Zn-dependent oxidoreductase